MAARHGQSSKYNLLSAHLDSCIDQFAHYKSLLAIDAELARLVKAVINNEARYVAEYPYCS